MEITLTEITATENVLEGIDVTGQKFRIRGTMTLTHFKDGQIDEGPIDYTGFLCEAIIDDTEAVLIIKPKLFSFCGDAIFQ